MHVIFAISSPLSMHSVQHQSWKWFSFYKPWWISVILIDLCWSLDMYSILLALAKPCTISRSKPESDLVDDKGLKRSPDKRQITSSDHFWLYLLHDPHFLYHLLPIREMFLSTFLSFFTQQSKGQHSFFLCWIYFWLEIVALAKRNALNFDIYCCCWSFNFILNKT